MKIVAYLENGNTIYASSYGDILDKAHKQKTRVLDYDYI